MTNNEEAALELAEGIQTVCEKASEAGLDPQRIRAVMIKLTAETVAWHMKDPTSVCELLGEELSKQIEHSIQAQKNPDADLN